MAREKGIKTKLKKIYFKSIGKIKNCKLKCKDFTIISNNCFAGIFYRNNNLPYNSPTCGLFIMPSDYIKFIYNMKEYLSLDMEELKIENSKYLDYLKKINYNGVIGKLNDIEIMFLHYDNFEEVKNVWNRRKNRINYDKIIYKFNDQNLCTYEDLKKFNDFKADNKICFTAKKYDEFNTIELKQFENEEYVLSDVNEKDYKKYIDMYKYINDRFKE
jgi:uncharacterized protein (DUF1919 family)